MVSIRPVTRDDASVWARLRFALWPEATHAEHARDVERFFAGQSHEPLAVLLARDAAGTPLGFAELSIRNVAEGCETDRVAYLEGWYVEPEARRQGVGRALVSAAEEWGRAQGCTEFASDTQIENTASAAAHAALGFEETERLRCFRKKL